MSKALILPFSKDRFSGIGSAMKRIKQTTCEYYIHRCIRKIRARGQMKGQKERELACVCERGRKKISKENNTYLQHLTKPF